MPTWSGIEPLQVGKKPSVILRWSTNNIVSASHNLSSPLLQKIAPECFCSARATDGRCKWQPASWPAKAKWVSRHVEHIRLSSVGAQTDTWGEIWPRHQKHGPKRGLHLVALVLGKDRHDAFLNLRNTKFQGVARTPNCAQETTNAHANVWQCVSFSRARMNLGNILFFGKSARTWKKRQLPASATKFLRSSTSSAREVFCQGVAEVCA